MKPSIYISCKVGERDELYNELCDHSFSTIKELPEYWIVMCEELQKQTSKKILIQPKTDNKQKPSKYNLITNEGLESQSNGSEVRK